MAHDDKTNVMRLLDQKKISYGKRIFTCDSTSGVDVATYLGEPPERVFKTLVTRAKSGQYYVFVIPVNRELNLKKAAKAVSEKSIAMIPQKELLPLTGYIHGGCSPIGMKKVFPTVLHESASEFDAIFFSAGRIGAQVEVAPDDLAKMIRITTADVCE